MVRKTIFISDLAGKPIDGVKQARRGRKPKAA
jgi:hypothetical protein